MRYRNPLDGLLFSTTAVRTLRALMTASPKGRTGREISRLARTPPHRTSEVLGRFQREGLVRSRVVGRAYLWSLTEGHPFVPALRALFEVEAKVAGDRKARLRRALSRAGGVRRAIIFGSAARGEEHAGSDLDLLVVASNREALERIQRKLAELRFDLWHEGGMRISPLLYTEREFRQKRNLAVIQAAESEGEVLVAGEEA